MAADPPSLTGGCGCGAVRWELTEPPSGAHYCHCTRCQHRSGTAASISASAIPGSFRIIAGEDQVGSWSPDDGWHKFFCTLCGSALYSQDRDDPGRIGIRMGSFDGDPGVRPSSRQFVDYAAAWEPIPDDGLPRHGERQPRAT